ncbi:MAG: alpha/beta fold hydrolase [Iamia sp.]
MVRPLRLAALAPLAAGGAWLWTHARSPAVGAWQAPTLSETRCGPLSTRVGGQGDTGILLLHGLVATGDVFAATAERLARDHRVAVPDLLGFGRSRDEEREDFGTDAHLDALIGVVDEVLGDRPLRIGAHSMGSTLALRLAAALGDRVERVMCLGAPVWPDPRAAVGATGPMARAFLLDHEVAARACALSCRHRELSGWLAAAGAPRWPVPIARQASLHTWPAYQQSMEGQILAVEWADLLASVDAAGIALTLAWGDHDPIGDPGYARTLSGGLDCVRVDIVADADHTIPTARPDLLTDHLRDR